MSYDKIEIGTRIRPSFTHATAGNNPLKKIDLNKIGERIYADDGTDSVYIGSSNNFIVSYDAKNGTSYHIKDWSANPIYDPSRELERKDIQGRVLFVTASLADYLALKINNARVIIAHPQAKIPQTESNLVLLCEQVRDDEIEKLRDRGITCYAERLGDGDIYEKTEEELRDFIQKYDGKGTSSHIRQIFESAHEEALKPRVSSGFGTLDDILGGGFTSKVYVLGAQPSYGKTTLALQIADHIASKGRPVRYLTFEQSEGDLILKCASRRCYLQGKKISASSFKSDPSIECPEKIIEDLEQLERTLKIIECSENEKFGNDGNLSKLDHLLNEVESSIDKGEEPPLIVVDHLQELEQFGDEAQYKNINEALDRLRGCSRKGAIVFILSQFNRQAYGKAASNKSFAGSSGIERKADVLLALDYRDIVLAKEKPTEQDIRKARDANPRKMCVSVIKHRMGRIGEVFLDYYSAYDTFEISKEKPDLKNSFDTHDANCWD